MDRKESRPGLSEDLERRDPIDVRRALWSALLAMLVIGVPTMAAAAQGGRPELERSQPRAGAVVHRAPRAVVLTFDRPIASEALTVTVLDACTQEVGDFFSVSGHRARVPLAADSKGRYSVVYEVIAGGGPKQDSFEFKVHAGPRCDEARNDEDSEGDAHAGHGGGGPRAQDLAAAPEPNDEAGPGALVSAVGISLVVGALGGWLLRVTDAR